MPAQLTRVSLLEAVHHLASRDRDLARILHRHGPPPLWARRPGFPTLARIILEQQVSLASARSAFERLTRTAGTMAPERIRTLGAADLRAVGITRQKARYILELANAVFERRIDLSQIGRLSDDAAREALMTVSGIGPWTADIYLLMALRREDVWPVADLALARAMQELRAMRRTPSNLTLQRMAREWRPHRSAAARMLWHQYLSSRASPRASLP